MRTSCTGTRNRLAPGTRASCGRRRATTAPTGGRSARGLSATNMNPELRAPKPPPVTAVTGGGFGARNSGFMFVALKPLAERPPVGAVVARLRPQLARVPGANLFLVPVQDVRIGGRQGTGTYKFTLQSDDLEALRRVNW